MAYQIGDYNMTITVGVGASGFAEIVSLEAGLVGYPKTLGEAYCYDPSTKKVIPEALAIGNGILGTLAAQQGYSFLASQAFGSSSFMTSDGVCWIAYLSNTNGSSLSTQYLSMFKRLPKKASVCELGQVPSGLPVTANTSGVVTSWSMPNIIECGENVFIGAVCAAASYSTTNRMRPFRLTYDPITQTFAVFVNNSSNMDGLNTSAKNVESIPVIYDGTKVFFVCRSTNSADVVVNSVAIDTLVVTQSAASGFRINDGANTSTSGNRQECNDGAWLLSDGNFAFQGWTASSTNAGGIYSESGGAFTRITETAASWGTGTRFLKIAEDTFLYFNQSASSTTITWRVLRYNTNTLDFDTIINKSYNTGQEPRQAITLVDLSFASRVENSIVFGHTSSFTTAIMRFDPDTFELDVGGSSLSMVDSDSGAVMKILLGVSWDDRGIAIQREITRPPIMGVFAAGAMVSSSSPIRLGYLSAFNGDILDITVIAPNIKVESAVVGETYSNNNYIAMSDELVVPRDKRPAIWERTGLANLTNDGQFTRFQDIQFESFGTLAIEPSATLYENTYISFDSVYGKHFYAEGIMFSDNTTNQLSVICVGADGMYRYQTFNGTNATTIFPQFISPNSVTLDVSGRAESSAAGDNYITYAIKEEQ